MPDFLLFSIPASSSSDGDSIALVPLLLCLSGFIYYIWIFLKYRNTDKRHHHENETVANIEAMQQVDQLVEHRKDLRKPTMVGSNSDTVEGSLSQSDGLSKTMNMIGKTAGLIK
jgi:hypothetical protein